MADLQTQLSDDYETLKNEAKEYAHQSVTSFFQMGIRLKKIKDNKLFEPEYPNFTTFLKEEFDGVRSTAYNYMSILENYDVQVLGQNPDFHYSKLLHALPLLRSKIDSQKKNYVKKKTLEAVQNGETESKIKEKVKQWKIKYGLIEEENTTFPVVEPDYNDSDSELSLNGATIITIGDSLSPELRMRIVDYISRNTKLINAIYNEISENEGE